MTKDRLQAYQRIKKEHAQVERLLRAVERQPLAGDNTERLKKYYIKKMEELARSQMEIEQAIETLDPVERQLLRLRYFEEFSWTKISQAIHYSRSETYRIHAKALRNLAEK